MIPTPTHKGRRPLGLFSRCIRSRFNFKKIKNLKQHFSCGVPKLNSWTNVNMASRGKRLSLVYAKWVVVFHSHSYLSLNTHYYKRNTNSLLSSTHSFLSNFFPFFMPCNLPFLSCSCSCSFLLFLITFLVIPHALRGL